ncbi:MAG TPA: TrkA family potassium uptake protein [bacterium]|nr:TrkA family potassium uptake protein [bacterium]
MAQIAVIGMSSFGYYMARKLAELGSDVLAIDYDETMVDKIKAYVSKAVVADATDRRAIQQLGLTGMDAVVLSLGDKLESSILAAMHLRELGVKKIVAKALSEDHAKILELIGVQRIVFPERDMGIRIASSLHGANIADYLPLGPDLSIIEMIPIKEMVGKTLLELEFRKRYHCQILAIRDKVPEEITFIPEPDTRIKASHLLVILGANKDLAGLQKS